MTALLTLPLAFLAQLFADALKAMPGFRVVSRTQIVPCHGQLIVAVTDPLQVGFRRQAMIGLTVDGDMGPVGDALAEIPEVDYVVTTAGSFDLLVEVVCEDDAHLLSLLTERIRTLPGVRSTETFVYLKLNKQHYNWGTR